MRQLTVDTTVAIQPLISKDRIPIISRQRFTHKEHAKDKDMLRKARKDKNNIDKSSKMWYIIITNIQ
ncbi:hypothetical protein KKE26_11985 [bacterium]|nr:hypothetical protein [bacterium]